MKFYSYLTRGGTQMPSPARAFLSDAEAAIQWWLSTLGSLLSPRVLNTLFAYEENPLLRFSNGDYLFEDSQIHERRDLLSALQNGKVDLIVEADQFAILRRRVPKTSTSNLRQIMGLKVEEETPFKTNEIVFDIRTLRQINDKELDVELAILTKSKVDEHCTALEALGLKLHAIDTALSDGTRAGFQLGLPSTNSATQNSISFGRLLILGIVLLSFIWVAGTFVQQNRSLTAVRGLITETQPQADAAALARTELDRIVDDLEALENRIAHPAKFQNVYQELSRIVPDHSWLQSFTYSNDNVVLAGLSNDPEDLIAHLNQSELIQDAKFTSSLVRDSRHDAERFRIEIALRESESQLGELRE